jgi:hypothetical protein
MTNKYQGIRSISNRKEFADENTEIDFISFYPVFVDGTRSSL